MALFPPGTLGAITLMGISEWILSQPLQPMKTLPLTLMRPLYKSVFPPVNIFLCKKVHKQMQTEGK